MAWVALNCPQCSAPLPRVAIWRSVTCNFCGALITRTESIVQRDTFRQALKRAQQAAGSSPSDVQCGGQRYHFMQSLGGGEHSQIYLARRLGALPCLVTVKLASGPSAAKDFQDEAQILRHLQTLQIDGPGAYFSQRLPEVVAVGAVDEGHSGQHALVLRHPTGYWGSLADLSDRFPQGIDPRHSVWIWRRILDVLGYVHANGWAHGNVRPEHALVHLQDHGVRLIGWGSAKYSASAKEQAVDLQRSARVIQVLLCGANGSSGIPQQVPSVLAQLVTQASDDESFCRTQGAQGLDASLRAAAQAAFGPPSFVPLTL